MTTGAMAFSGVAEAEVILAAVEAATLAAAVLVVASEVTP